MTGSSETSPTDLGPVVHPVVRELLREHEVEDSLTSGTIVDIATIAPSSPYDNFEIELDRLINSSKQLVESVANTNRHHDCIAIAVELPNEEFFIDLFTYKSSENSEYPSVESLAMSLGVDISSVHHLIGKEVDIVQQDNRWTICEHCETPPVEPSVTRNDFLNPLAITGLLAPLGFFIGWHTDISIILTTVAGVLAAILSYAFLLYLTLAAKRDHPLPGYLGRIFTPDYSDDAGVLSEGDNVVDVNQGEFKHITTLAGEDEHDSPRAVLHNLAIVVTIPPDGEKVVPVPSPTTGWRETVIKGLVFTLSSSVETLDRAEGELVPLCRNGNRIAVDRDRLKLQEPSRSRTFAEKTADAYVSYINSVFGTPVRNDLYR